MKKVMTLLLFINFCFSQEKNAVTKTFFPKDSILYSSENGVSYHDESNLYGKTTLIITHKSENGNFHFILKKKIKKLQRLIEYKNYATLENFDFKKEKWEYSEDSKRKQNKTDIGIDTTFYSEHNLYAFVNLEEHDGFVEKCKFQDFGNIVYWPEFDYSNCIIADEDKDGFPEFYLSYMGESDGLDAKPYKQIVYTKNSNNFNYIKSKATAYYPAGNEEDIYFVEFDTNWNNLNSKIKEKSKSLIEQHKTKYIN
jgi:hypothetical protein